MYVKIPHGTTDVGRYAIEQLGFEKIALYFKSEKIKERRLPVDLRAYIEGLVKLVSTPSSNNQVMDKFVKKFIVYYPNGPQQSLKVLTSKEELERILDHEQLAQRVPILMLATAAQLEKLTTPISISEFLFKREAHEKALANKENLLNELKEEAMNASAKIRTNIVESAIAQSFAACIE